MRYFAGVVDGRFVMLLAISKGCKSGESGEVGRPYFTVGRRRRDGIVEGYFGREAISAHDIGFRVVVACEEIGAGKAGGSIEMACSGEGGEGANAIDVAGAEEVGEGGVANLTVCSPFGFFACLVSELLSQLYVAASSAEFPAVRIALSYDLPVPFLLE